MQCALTAGPFILLAIVASGPGDLPIKCALAAGPFILLAIVAVMIKVTCGPYVHFAGFDLLSVFFEWIMREICSVLGMVFDLVSWIGRWVLAPTIPFLAGRYWDELTLANATRVINQIPPLVSPYLTIHKWPLPTVAGLLLIVQVRAIIIRDTSEVLFP